MEAVNIFSAPNTEGRIDVARAVGSAETYMFIYDLEPGQGSSPTTTSTKRNGCSSSKARWSCVRPTGSTSSREETSFASRPVRRERTRS